MQNLQQRSNVAHMTTATGLRQALEWTTGDRLRKAREVAGLHQQELADALEVSRGTIYNYEHMKVDLQKRLMRQWALRTGVALEWIETGHSERRKSDEAAAVMQPMGYVVRVPRRRWSDNIAA